MKRVVFYVKTETPYWLDEAYQEAIADTDIKLANM
jgi:hypothetical protein